MTTKQRTTIIWAGSVGALAISELSGLLLANQTAIVRVSMIFSVAAVLLNLIAIPLFLIGLKRFRIELRQAYITLCIGIGIFGLAQVQLPIVNLNESGFWVDSGAIAIPYLLGVLCIFWSMRMLSQLLAIKSLWSSGLLALLVTAVISLLAALLPHVHVTIDELSYDIALTLSIWNSVFITFAAILVFKVRRKIGLSYVNSMDWLFRSLAILSFAGWHYTAMQLVFTVGDWYYDYSIAILPFVAGAFTLMIAGFTFGAIDVQQRQGTSPSPLPDEIAEKVPTVLSPSQELEVVLYVTNLVSNPTEIDTALNDVRLIVSRIQPGQDPSSEDQKMLDAIYAKLEDYLLRRDPLRVFTKDELRKRISKRFGLNSEVKTTLWRQDQ